VVDGLPGWQVMGQQPPGAAGPHPVGHGVDQLAAVVDGWSAARLGGRDERGEQLPLGVGQVGWVAAAGRVTGGFLVADGSDSRGSYELFRHLLNFNALVGEVDEGDVGGHDRLLSW
jgi:hypothetical protein